MALKSALNAEMKRLKGDAKALEKKRSELTADIDKKIAENARKQEMLQDFMDATFGAKPKLSTTRGKAPSGTRRKRKNRKGVKQRVLNAINASTAGIKRKAIIEEIGMASSDESGHQYVSNTLRALLDEGQIENRGRVYFPKSSSETGEASPSSVADQTTESSLTTPASDSPDDEPRSGSSGFGSGSLH
ncbi:MAG: hypothetical protein OXG25_00670 [Gammaproteobacteria bacterium]|nr:hypothetical protein [Gammaproteobacteria bacterium]